ncbi:MAG: SLBB domain-containing protein [Prevotella sp.]|nr:SLBB domain-containing protein [Prevotella sp.]
MKKTIIYVLIGLLMPLAVAAQSSMTDDQVIRFVLKEHEAGTDEKQIVTKLMQRGVDIQQIRRVKKIAERQKKNAGLGMVQDETMTKANDRSRKNNTEKKATEMTTQRVQGERTWKYNYDEDDDDFIQMQSELEGIMPVDSIALLEKLLAEREKEKQKVFGRDIFSQKDLTFEPSMNVATPKNYILGPGDAVFIDIYGASAKQIETSVSPDGYVNIDGFGPVYVSGMTVEQANTRLRSTLGSRYQSSRVKLTVGQTRTITVNVMDEVKSPGTYTLPAFATVFHALYMANGISDIGTLRNIKVYRNNKLVSTVDVYDYILNGKQTGNIRLADNDFIVVEPYDCLVKITGKVKRPMFYEMKKDESIGTLLKYSGGFTGDAYTKSVRVVRKTGRQYSVFNVGEFDMDTFHVADGDSVSVDSILDRYENTVELKGAVFRTGKYQLGGNITTVRSLLDAAEGVTEEAFLNRAVMHRMKSDRTLEVLSVDVKGILDGTAADIPLRENDILFIPTKQEAQTERTITIYGEVMHPGIYQYADNETIEDFILQAGGLKENASTVKVDVSRRVSNPKALVADSVIARTFSMELKDGFVIDGEPGFILMPFDEVYVRQSPGYYKQQNVTIEGEVMFGGTYTLSKKTQRLSDLVKMAGGVNDRAFTQGARLERRYTQQERQRAEAVLKKAREDMEFSLQEQAIRTGNANLVNLSESEQLKKYQIGDTYPVGIELDKAIANPGGMEDIVLREGDRVFVPQFEATVKINGEVLYPNTVGYVKGKSVGYYIDQAGGFSSKAKKKQAYIIYMNGTVAKVGHNAKPLPGCEIVVPSKSTSKTTIAETLSITTSIGSLAAIIATIANLLK